MKSSQGGEGRRWYAAIYLQYLYFNAVALTNTDLNFQSHGGVCDGAEAEVHRVPDVQGGRHRHRGQEVAGGHLPAGGRGHTALPGRGRKR